MPTFATTHPTFPLIANQENQKLHFFSKSFIWFLSDKNSSSKK
ncbi:hypothetical protein M23134_06291 [Microscilla marina ATCC 23134]|uniref:Uncharacterized protein n=1 Tax=Microscilla marina ATCC 23134 TaxID=313606 RepID=A1ZYU0_MICM2|nr:hypothetical protein M23134_06291 [Microscilla marina ATCC 23134]